MSYPRKSVSSAADGAGVPASPNFPSIEEGMLAYWATDNTFLASVENREGAD